MARRGRPPVAPSGSGQPARNLSDEEELALALDVAKAYYLADESKVAIAARFGVTRFQVARLLDVARESGMVHIEVRAPGGIDRELSVLLQAALGIREAIVVSSLAGVSPLDDVGFALARTVSSMVRPGDVVGLTWSRATISMTNQLTHLEPCSLVQLGGHVEAAGLPGTVEIVRRAAQISGGVAYPIYAPLVVQDAHTAESLRRQATIAEAISMFDRLTMAVVSIGAWMPSGSTIYDSSSEDLRRKATDAGAVGEISGRLFDAQGEPLPFLIDDQVIGISLDQLRRVPDVIVTSYGAYRADATIAAARAGLINTLVTDRSLAQAIVERIAQP